MGIDSSNLYHGALLLCSLDRTGGWIATPSRCENLEKSPVPLGLTATYEPIGTERSLWKRLGSLEAWGSTTVGSSTTERLKAPSRGKRVSE